jgi:hypothetical protein
MVDPEAIDRRAARSNFRATLSAARDWHLRPATLQRVPADGRFTSAHPRHVSAARSARPSAVACRGPGRSGEGCLLGVLPQRPAPNTPCSAPRPSRKTAASTEECTCFEGDRHRDGWKRASAPGDDQGQGRMGEFAHSPVPGAPSTPSAPELHAGRDVLGTG